MDIVELELRRMMRTRALPAGSAWMMMMSWMKDLMRFWERIGMLGVIYLGELRVGQAIQMEKARVRWVCTKALRMYDRLYALDR